MSRFHYVLCAIPLALLIVAGVVGYQGPLIYAALLLCPLMMLAMMAGMHGGHHEHRHDRGEEADAQTPAAFPKR